MPKALRSRTAKSNHRPPAVWQALNEPVVEVTEGFAKTMLFIALLLLCVSWIGPSWEQAKIAAARENLGLASSGRVAGVYLAAVSQADTALPPAAPRVPEWYYLAQGLPYDIGEAFAQSASEVLDISDQAGPIVEFYEPGVAAVWDAWLELMADPY